MNMPFKTGNWGDQAKIRSEKRREYFIEYQKKRHVLQKETISDKNKAAYCNSLNEYKSRSLSFYYIKIPEGSLCEECHSSLAKHRHHANYDKPLEVQFLCISCHRKKARKGGVK